MKELSYKNDVTVLKSLDAAAILTTGTLLLLRHGNAGSRSEWTGDDALRPLSNRGQHQAEAIADAFVDRGIERILSSPYLRCRQTVEPLASMLNVKIEERAELAEGTGHRPARDLCRELIGTNAVLCSHGDVIPAVLDWMVRHGTSLKSSFDCKKASTWEIEVKAGEFQRAHYLPPPL
jgi:8-oxo-dGTP diphosphatase